jgi:hypothetical protein
MQAGVVSSAVLGALCWSKGLLGLSGPLSVNSPVAYRALVLLLVPLSLGTWLRGLSEMGLGRREYLARLGARVAWLGIAYVVLAGLEQYFLGVFGFSIPWAGSGYLLILLGVLFVGIAVLLSTVLPVWSRVLPLVLGFLVPPLMLVGTPEEYQRVWLSSELLVGVGFLVLSGALRLSAQVDQQLEHGAPRGEGG